MEGVVIDVGHWSHDERAEETRQMMSARASSGDLLPLASTGGFPQTGRVARVLGTFATSGSVRAFPRIELIGAGREMPHHVRAELGDRLGFDDVGAPSIEPVVKTRPRYEGRAAPADHRQVADETRKCPGGSASREPMTYGAAERSTTEWPTPAKS